MFNKNLLTILLLLFFSSCMSNLEHLSIKEQSLRSSKTLNGYLGLEYLQYARDLEVKERTREANYFAKKGNSAADNKPIYPEVPEKWKLDETQIEEATVARTRLLELLYNQRANQYLAPQLAHLHLLYDCWITNENNDDYLAQMARCKILFFHLEDEINRYLKQMDKKEEAKKVNIIEIKEPEFERFDIYFDLNLTKFNSKADKVFVDLYRHLESLNGDYKIMIVGNADRLGKKLYNEALARKRALAVKTRLLKNGVPQDLITVKSFGSENNQILTLDGDYNKNNRVVSVYILKGRDSLEQIPLPLIDNFLYRKEILKTKKQRGL